VSNRNDVGSLLNFALAIDSWVVVVAIEHENTSNALLIGAQQLGRRKPLFADYALPLPAQAQGGTLTLGELLGYVVRAEVLAFSERQSERRLLKALSSAQLASGLQLGKVSSGGSELEQAVDADQSLAIAVQAFRDGLYLVIVDAQEVHDLSTVLTLHANSRMSFVRLTALVGG
jgi:hypothetical protein